MKRATPKEKRKEAIMRLVFIASMLAVMALLLQEFNRPSGKDVTEEAHFDKALNQKIRDCYALRRTTAPQYVEYEAGTYMTVQSLLRGTQIPREEVKFSKCADTFSLCSPDAVRMEFETHAYVSARFQGGICYIDFDA